jgi:F-box protein 21
LTGHRWHATDAIRYIHRRNALKIFKKLRVKPESVPLEMALGALELFSLDAMKPDLEDTMKEFDSLTAEFLSATPKFDILDIQAKARALIRWMWKSGFKGASAERYRALKNMFIGMSLRPGLRTSIPLTLTAIFVAIARRAGFIAHACTLPGMVYLRVDAADGTPTFYDIFNVNFQTSGEVVETQLVAHSTLAGENLGLSYRRPAPTSELVLRMAGNIVHTLQLPHINRLMASNGYPPVYEHSAIYAALTAMVILNPTFARQHIVSHLTHQIPMQFPMDVRFLEEELLPRIDGKLERESLINVCNALRAEDSTPRSVWKRDNPETCGVEVCPSHSSHSGPPSSTRHHPHTWIPPTVIPLLFPTHTSSILFFLLTVFAGE